MQQQGTVTFFSPKGFGFIQPDGDADSAWFHINSVDESYDFDTVPKGARVSFDVGPSRKDPSKMEARNVKVISEGNR
jgi:cold shock CspA family protein